MTLAISAPVVKFGTQVTLTGAVNNKKTGETVTIAALPFGQTTKEVVATLQTTTGGAFSFNVTPQLNTTYQAQWKGAESSVGVQVQPTIKLPFVSRSGYFHFYVTAGQSFAGRFVYLQRYTLTRTWINLRKLQLGQQSGTHHGDEVRPLVDSAWPLVDSDLHAGQRDAGRLHRLVERNAAGRQASNELRERGLLVRALVLLRTASQLTTFHQASRYSGRRFWYFR